MSLQDTGPRILLAVLIGLLLFVIAFFAARGSSSQAALAPVREERLAGPAGLKHAPLRAIGTAPALPPARRKAKRKPPPAPPGRPAPPPPTNTPAPAPPIAPAPRPPAPPEDCIGEGCPR